MTQWLRTAYCWLTDTLPPVEFASDVPPHWVADVRVRVLPPGRDYRFRAQLWSGRVSLVSRVDYFCFTLAGPFREEWSRDRAVGLLRLVEAAFGAPAPQQACMVMDGLPSEIRLFRREPPGIVWQSWNLAAWWYPPELVTGLPPAVQLAAELYHRAAEPGTHDCRRGDGFPR